MRLLPKDTLNKKPDGSYTRQVMGLAQDDEEDEFDKYIKDSLPVDNLNTFNPIKW
jgi:hypothetical protein